MKTILITGGKSFLAREFVNYFKNYQLIITDKNNLDVTNKKTVDDFFNNNQIDFVLHTAIKGGSRLKEDTFQDLIDNLNMYNNLSNNYDKFKLMINFASGAEFDRRRDIKEINEEEIFNSYPIDYYGHSKNLIAKEVLEQKNIINIRLFGCFGKYENDTRFIKSTINKCHNNEDIIIDDKQMDFISTKDLFILIENFLKNDIKYKDINAVYNKKVDLLYIAEYIKKLTNSKSSIILKEKSRSYSGSSTKIDTLNLNFAGLEESIREMIK